MQAIIFLSKQMDLADGLFVSKWVGNIQYADRDGKYAVVVLPEGQTLQLPFENIIEAEDISTCTWILKNQDGAYMVGVVDSTFPE